MADGEQIKQVFINVLDNAVEATAERGEIQIVDRHGRRRR